MTDLCSLSAAPGEMRMHDPHNLRGEKEVDTALLTHARDRSIDGSCDDDARRRPAVAKLSTALCSAPSAMDDLGLPWAAEDDAGIPFLSETEFHELWGAAGSPGGGGGGGSGAPPPSFSGLRCLDSTHADGCKMCVPRTLRCASVLCFAVDKQSFPQQSARVACALPPAPPGRELGACLCWAPSCPRALGSNLASPPLLLRPPTLASDAGE